MRPKQSSTAIGMYSSTGRITPPLLMQTAHPPNGRTMWLAPIQPPVQVQSDGLLHDARNLMGTLGLYCDLLSMPGVLKPEHREYANDLRLVGTHSGALIERLAEQLTQERVDGCGRAVRSRSMDANPTASTGMQMARIVSAPRPAPVSLRRTIERCLGLLSRVACGRCVEVDYGEAAAAPVAVDEEAVERIVVNLVRNAAAALAEQGAAAQGGAGAGEVRQGLAAIRITVGALVNRVGDPRPWPFRRVRLTVDDCGIGMDPDQLERLLRGSPPRGGHGIGFRVVRELVATSGGELRVKSAPGVGTCVQIEWPATVAALAEGAGRRTNAASSLVRNGLPGEVQAGGQGLGEGRPGGPRGGGSC